MTSGNATGSMDRVFTAAEITASLRGWRRALLAFALGSVLTLSLAPLFLFFVLPLSLAPFLWQLRGCENLRATIFTAWCYWAGFLWAGLYWISFSMLVDAERFAWAIPLGSLALPLAIALIPAAGAALLWHLKGDNRISVVQFAAVMTAFQWLQGQIFTGLPWNLPGYSFAATDGLLQSASLIGVYGLTFLALLVGAAPADFGQGEKSWRRRALPSVLVLLVLAGMHIWGEQRLEANPTDLDDSVFVRLVQPNIPQSEKWAVEFRKRNLELYQALAQREHARPITHLIFPEAALPYLLANDPRAAALVGAMVDESATVISGTIRRAGNAGQQSYNSLAVISGTGQLLATYDKMHLVPFGEYLPLRFLLSPLGLDKVVFGATDYDQGAGPLTVKVPGLPPLRALICYEGVFSDEIALSPETALMVNVTNDAWFGETAGPWQHFEMERMRTVEQGVPMLRAANTGISAVIDPSGRVLQSLTLGQRGVLDSALPKALITHTFFRKFGDLPLLVGLSLILLWGLFSPLFGRFRRDKTP